MSWIFCLFISLVSINPVKAQFSVNATGFVNASPEDVWPVVRELEMWSDWQDTFDIELIDGGVVDVGKDILITSQFPTTTQQTLETINKIEPESPRRKICWILKSFVIGSLKIPIPDFLLKTDRCIEIIDSDNGDTSIVLNWIVYTGFLAPIVIFTTGSDTLELFDNFNDALYILFA